MKPILSLFLLFSMISCKAQQKPDKGWQNLLADNNLSGWHSYGKNYAGKAWEIENGVLHFSPKDKDAAQKGDLTTNEAYENFHLKLEWKISKNGNSGILFLVNDDATKYKQPYLTGPEMQVLDNNGHPDAKIHKHRAGDLYDLIPSKKETVKPVGEWNKAEIIVKNAHLEFYLNGEKVVSTVLWDKNWDEMIAGSKFKDMPDFAKFRKGKIVLQDHRDEVWFRNIMIKRL